MSDHTIMIILVVKIFLASAEMVLISPGGENLLDFHDQDNYDDVITI